MRSDHPTATNGVDVAASRQSELARVLDGYLAAVEAGEVVDPDVLVAEHPEIAERESPTVYVGEQRRLRFLADPGQPQPEAVRRSG